MRKKRSRIGWKVGGRAIGDGVLLVLTGFLLALSWWLCTRYGYGRVGDVASDSMSTHIDFDVFWHSARALVSGEDIYYGAGGPDISHNPPIWTVLMAPFGLMADPLAAYRAFVPVAVVALLGAVAWIAHELRLGAASTVAGAAALLASSPMIGTLAIGQMYTLLALGLVAAWVFERRERPIFSGIALGMVVAVKPSLAPVLLWPLIRRKWRTFSAAVASGAAATLVGEVVVAVASGRFGATLDWLGVLGTKTVDGFYEHASLPGAASRLFRENSFAAPLTEAPGTLTATLVLGVGLILFTAWVVGRRDPAAGLWALAAAALLASPVTWYNYLVILGPGVLVLLARGRTAPALLLLSLGLVPGPWLDLWRDQDTALAALMLALYTWILLAYWAAFSFSVPERDTAKQTKPLAGG